MAGVLIDEADIVMAAAVAWDVDAAEILAECDLRATVAIAGDAACADSPLDAAAAILTGVLERQPFRPTGLDHQPVAWLACVHVLARAGLELRHTPGESARLLREAARALPDTGAVRDVLAAFTQRRPAPLTRWLRRALRPRSVIVERWHCPACGRAVPLRSQDAVTVTWLGVGASGPLLLAHCRCGGGRSGDRSEAGGVVDSVAAGLPVVEAPNGPDGALLALGPGGAVVFLPRRQGRSDGRRGTIVYEVGVVGEPGPSELVGDWGRLLLAADRRVAVCADAVRVDERTGRLDVRHLAAAAPEAAALLDSGRAVACVS